MRNEGKAPRYERVDLQFRNGQTARSVDPAKYRWATDPRFSPAYAFDIIAYQPAKP